MSNGPKKAPEQRALLEVAATEKPEQREEAKESAGRFVSPRPFRPWQPEQGQLLPQYTRQVLGEGHLACFFAGLASVLDFGPILKAYTKQCGQPAYHPVMMTLLLMYAYAKGIPSRREIEKRCETDLAFRYLTGGQKPDHDTLCSFRVKHLEAFGALLEEWRDPAVRAERLKRAQRQLEADKKVELAVEKEKRLEMIRQAQQQSEEEARRKAAEKGQNVEEARPDPKAQRNFTDPESRIMPRDGGFQQSYNAQVAVDADTQLILAQEVGQSVSDMRQLTPMVAHVEANTGLVPMEMSADSGYFCREDIGQVDAKGVEVFVAVGQAEHGHEPEQAPSGRPPNGLRFKERMRRKLQTKRGRRAYARRKVTAELVIGQVKNTVLGRFSLRGLVKVSGEFSLACAEHNLKKLWKLRWELPAAGLEAAA